MSLLHRLHDKGWSEQELSHLEHHTALVQASKDPSALFAERFMYWFFLLTATVSIVAFGEFFFPVLSLLPIVIANITVALFAGIFAVLFGHVLHTLDDLAHGHHLLVILVAGITAVGSSWLIAAKSLRLGILFAIVFCLLYSFYWYTSYERTKSA